MVTVETEHGIRYEDYHPKCKCIFSEIGTQPVAFIQGFDVKTGEIKRYWGKCNPENMEASIHHILLRGSKWPRLGQGDPDDEG